MTVDVKPGKYILALSGGVDSMVLLDLLANRPDVELVVGHFNHGIRADSTEDEKLVALIAKKQGLPFEIGYGRLGPNASEAIARTARYNFLKSIKIKHSAQAIITAHHQDDLIETACINILRGSGPRGLIAMKSSPELLRPLLSYRKIQIINYAQSHQLRWREDSSNQNEKYLRNYLRLKVLSGLKDEQRREIISNIDKVAIIIEEEDKIIATLSHSKIKNRLDRSKLSLLPSEVAAELIANWLRISGLRDFDGLMINRANIFIRTGRTNARYNLSGKIDLVLSSSEAKLQTSL